MIFQVILDFEFWILSPLSMDLVAADVSPLIIQWRSLSRLTSAATNPNWFMVPMHGHKTVEAFHGLTHMEEWFQVSKPRSVVNLLSAFKA